MWLLFIPVVLVVVLALMLVGSLFAGVFWLIGAGWPWLLIGLGMWMFWHHDGRHYRRSRDMRRGWDSRRWPSADERSSNRRSKRAAADAEPATTSAGETSQSKGTRQTELPIDVQVKVEQIRRKVDVLLGYADRFPPFSQDLYLVRQTASDYLPRTINAYLALTRQNAEKPLAADGKTAHQELKAQLDLLDSKLDEIAQDLQRQDADRLLANRRFLESRFGMRDDKPFVIKNGAA